MDELKKLKRILPLTPWSARSFWSFETKPILVLCISLMFFGIGDGMLVTAGLGSAPWTVLAQGISLQSGLNIGMVTFLISAVLLVLWIPLRQRFGLGTVLNMLVIAVVLGLYVRYMPHPTHIAIRILLCIGGILVIGTASAFYLTCHLGAGARDGLMVGLCSLSGWRIGWVRTALEGSVCLAGWLLGGTVGIGTLLFAFGVGWVVQTALGLIEKLPVRQAV
ncbi:membrane protein YczE [Neisseria zalophi]|uniref:YitT family protein n=1 Tax=Neisseria zalophi TaxID=640030 RepID=A0A5J6PVI0_9NEIS|nr:YitT family protein [Neisseria zalophi]QEY26681.1 YitT family protein [Neisseria zalophi]